VLVKSASIYVIAMNLSCLFALYARGRSRGVGAALAALSECGLELEPGPMSTLVRGFDQNQQTARL
jgi:hypothetical protein